MGLRRILGRHHAPRALVWGIFFAATSGCGTEQRAPDEASATLEQRDATTSGQGAVCDSSAHETTSLGATYSFDLDCAVAYLQAAGCDFALDPDGNGDPISSSTIEDMFNDPAGCQVGTACTGCTDGDSIHAVHDCTSFAAFSYFTESAWRDMQAQCPAGAAPSGCEIEGVAFDEDQASCALQRFASITCDDCMALFDSRVCEDAFNAPGSCQSGTTCTGCTDGDSRENGVTCEEIAAYSYFGPTAAEALLAYVQQQPCGGACTPVCDGRACGDDGCGGSCGTCAAGTTCDPTGQCTGGSCTIEGVYFDALQAECAEVFFESMDCATCGALLDTRTCEDAIEDPAACQSGDTCTGCADGDTRNDGVTCEEIAAYAYFGSTSAQKLLDYVKADPSCGVPELVVEGVPLTPEQAADILAVANGATVDQLDTGARLDARAAQNIVASRPFASIEQLAAVPYVGTTAIGQLRDYAPQWSAGEPPSQVSVQALADEVATHGEASTWLGTTVVVDRAIVTSTPISGAAGYVKFDIADPFAGPAEQLLVYVAASAEQDTAWLSLFDEVSLVGNFTLYGSTFEVALTDPATHAMTLNKSGLKYEHYQTVQGAWPSTAANPEGAVRVESTFGYTYMVPLPLFQHHPMWGGTPPAPPANSGNEQDYNWLIAAQDALDAWQ